MNLKMRIIPVLAAVLLASCSNNASNKQSSSAFDIAKEQEINLVDCLSQKEEQYLVFFHSETCSKCQQIIGDVIEFANANIVTTYFLDIKKAGNEIQTCTADELVLGVDNVDDLRILGTPTIIKVENGTTVANVAGKEKCLTFLNEQRMDDKK